MPRSRKRPGHHYQKPADIPARQRTHGKVVWSILFAVFGLVMAFFASDGSYVAMVIGAVIGTFLGFAVGKNVDREAAR